MLMSYDWIPIPLVYTQVVLIAVYSYAVASLLGHQYIEPTMVGPDGPPPPGPGHLLFSRRVDMYFPVMLMLQFIFYMGKVAD